MEFMFYIWGVKVIFSITYAKDIYNSLQIKHFYGPPYPKFIEIQRNIAKYVEQFNSNKTEKD